MPLFDDSGQTQEERTDEVRRILPRLIGKGVVLTDKELIFIQGLDLYKSKSWFKPTAKQLFWLRDILEKYGL